MPKTFRLSALAGALFAVIPSISQACEGTNYQGVTPRQVALTSCMDHVVKGNEEISNITPRNGSTLCGDPFEINPEPGLLFNIDGQSALISVGMEKPHFLQILSDGTLTPTVIIEDAFANELNFKRTDNSTMEQLAVDVAQCSQDFINSAEYRVGVEVVLPPLEAEPHLERFSLPPYTGPVFQ